MKLTAKQRRFIEEYCVDFNATQAAIRAGYSKRTAYAIGAENLRKPQIREAIEQRLKELSMSAAEATRRLTDWGRGTIEPFLHTDGNGNVRVDLSTEEARRHLHLIRKLKQKERVLAPEPGEEGVVLDRTFEIELHDAKDAVVQLARIHGLFVEKHEHSGSVSTPTLEVVVKHATQTRDS
ncbi:MAG TPA: terminase small subunit [Longimicrobiales bacterium]